MKKEEKTSLLELMEYVDESQKRHDEYVASLTERQKELYWAIVEDVEFQA